LNISMRLQTNFFIYFFQILHVLVLMMSCCYMYRLVLTSSN
jgi:hypothetical protein